MPRTIALGNGRLFIAYDHRCAVRELTWPHIGLANHLHGNKIKLGIWVDGHLAWFDDEGWHRDFGAWPAGVRLIHEGLHVTVSVQDHVLKDADAWVRSIQIENRAQHEREFRLFSAHALDLGGSDIGDTALYDPSLSAMVHYHGHFTFGIRIIDAGGAAIAPHGYAAGLKGFGAHEGTWRDADDGVLSGNPVAQGSVDSTIALHVTIPAGGVETLRLVAAMAESEAALAEVLAAGGGWPGDTHEPLNPDLKQFISRLPDEWRRTAENSLQLIHSHCDEHGAIIAAIDSDILETNRATYSYCWPRDAARIASVLARSGEPASAHRFLDFCESILPPDGFFLQKYRPDGRPGSTWHPRVHEGQPQNPIQQDQTTAVLALACEVDPAGRRGEIVRMADAICDFRSPDGLPLPSYDAWEERRGVHVYTCLSAASALDHAAQAVPEDPARSERYNQISSQIVELIIRACRREDGSLGRSLGDDKTDSLTLAGCLIAQRLLPHGMLRAQVDATERDLRTANGGIARYPGDYYFRRGDGPGNAWPICTLWTAQARISLAVDRADLDAAAQTIRLVQGWADPTGALPEQVDPTTSEPLSVSPLAWSQAEFVETVRLWAETHAALAD